MAHFLIVSHGGHRFEKAANATFKEIFYFLSCNET